MLLYLFLLLSHFIAMGSMNSIKPESPEEVVAEGRNISLTCKYEGSIYSIQWYRQYQRSRPEFLLYITEGGLIHPTLTKFSARISTTEKQVDLKISSAAVTDSAVYYCAVRLTNFGNSKLIFASGTKLKVEDREDYEPSQYLLKAEDTDQKACLATGYSRYSRYNRSNPLPKGLDWYDPVRISGDSLYNSVALLKGGEEGNCANETKVLPCVDNLEKDPTVNTVSLVVLGLRLLFIKTVIFNVLMTLRLWISQ